MTNKIKYIDSLRGLAILGVITTHTVSFFPNIPPIIYTFFHNGNKGVQLFFIVSALTLVFSIKKKANISSKTFYIKRYFRIAPAFYTAILFYFIMNLLFIKLGIDTSITYTYSFSNFIATLTFINILHIQWLYSLVPGGWSISNEFIFYLILPSVIKKVNTINKAILLVIISIIIGMLTTIIGLSLFNYKSSSFIYFYYWFPNQFPIFSLGILLYFLLKNKEKINEKINVNKYKFIYTSLLFMFFIILYTLPDISYLYYFKHYLIGILFILSIYMISEYQPKYIVNSITQSLGIISFSMYLIHFCIIDIIIHLFKITNIYNPNSCFQLIFTIIMTTLITAFFAHYSYKYIEFNGIRLGNKLISKKYMKD